MDVYLQMLHSPDKKDSYSGKRRYVLEVIIKKNYLYLYHQNTIVRKVLYHQLMFCRRRLF